MGLITRRRDETDRRKVILAVTDKGREAFVKADEIYDELNARIDEDFTPEEKDKMLEAFRILDERVHEYCRQEDCFNGKN